MKLKKILMIIIALFMFVPSVKAKEKEGVDVYLFYSELCSTCASENAWLEDYVASSDIKINVIKYEVTRNDDNALLLTKVRDALNNNELTTPYTVIGTMGITGFSDTVKNQIMKATEKYNGKDYVDIVDVVKNDLSVDYKVDYPETDYDIPVLGNINPKDVSLPLISVVIGFVDGFNPCAMWVLLFLISMLFNMKNRKKMWVLGITFLFTSALTYLCFMLAWLQIAINLSMISWVRIIIALIALIGSYVNIASYIKDRRDDSGCEVVDDKKRKNIFKRIKKIISNVDNKKGFVLAFIGIIGLAISVNLIELACSSGLPLIFTQILAINELNNIQYLIYILIYLLFFLIDDIVIFIIAMKTLKLTGISTKYNKFSHLIGGIIMFIIGLLMIIKPEWLMFKF